MPTILIVEHHNALRAALLDFLGAALPDSRLLDAATAEGAVERATAERPDIVLMDINSPEMNGIEVTRRIKAALPAARVVMLSLHEEAQYRAAASKAGASAFVPKIRIHEELLPVVRRLLVPGSD